MVILIGSAGARVCIFTANMREQDWFFMNQSIWGHDFPRQQHQQPAFARPPQAAFASDLFDYLRHYPSSLHPLIHTLREFDFSAARVVLLPSVPGYHRGADMHRFGHMRVRAVLQAQQLPTRFQDATLVCQYSSLGSLTEKWLFDEFGTSMTACHGSDDAGGSKSRQRRPNIHCIWPTVEDVRSSVLGYASGGSMPCPDKNMKDFLRPLLHRWRGVDARHAAMPHLKSYARVLPSGEIAWAIMTSSNLSKAAWGELQKDGSQLQIRSYELGVLFLPSHYQSGPHAAVAVASKAAFSSGGANVLGKRKADEECEPVRFFASERAAHAGQASSHTSAVSSQHRFCPFPFDALAPSYQRGGMPVIDHSQE
jgi:tyrosyl-DNA phosphodiesterase-1